MVTGLQKFELWYNVECQFHGEKACSAWLPVSAVSISEKTRQQGFILMGPNVPFLQLLDSRDLIYL